jgi:hypothetical protein
MSVKANRRMEMRTLSCQLNDEEVEAKGRELARLALDARDQEEALDAYLSGVKEEKRRLELLCAEKRGAVTKLADEIATRTVRRDVQCDWHFDLDGGQAILVRRDSGAAVTKRPITDEERQMEIGEKLEAANADQVRIWEQQLRDADAKRKADGVDEGGEPA